VITIIHFKNQLPHFCLAFFDHLFKEFDIFIFTESSQNSIQGDADEPSTSSSGQYPVQENLEISDQSISNQTPLKEKPAVLQNSPLNDNEDARPVSNGIVDDDDDSN